MKIQLDKNTSLVTVGNGRPFSHYPSVDQYVLAMKQEANDYVVRYMANQLMLVLEERQNVTD